MELGIGPGRSAKAVRLALRQQIGRMGIDVIQEGKKRAFGLAAFGQPVKKLKIHDLGGLTIPLGKAEYRPPG